MDEAYRIAKWWVYKKMADRLPWWAEPEDMIQEGVTRLIERGGDPRMAGDSYKFFMVQDCHTPLPAAQPKTRARG